MKTINKIKKTQDLHPIKVWNMNRSILKSY
jgi:hypothetical protein